MDKKWLVIIGGILVIILIATLFSLKNPKVPGTSPSTSLEECKTLAFKGDEKINIVFFAEKKEAEKYKNFFLTIKPFDKNANEFNFFYIDNYAPKCEIYKGIALLCYNKELVKKASSCPNDILVVVKEENSKIRSSAYMNVISLNSKLQTSVFPHEFAHVFANLAEEYVPAELPRSAKNCQKNCDNFNIKDGCFDGCSKNNYYRSINDGLMKTLYSKNFGLFNEFLIEQRIKRQSGITGKVVKENTNCAEEKYYLIEASYNAEGNVVLLSKSIENGCFNGNGYGEYFYSTNDNIQIGNFNPKFIFTDIQNEEQTSIEGEVFINDNDKIFLLKLPVDERITILIIKDEINVKKVTVDENIEGEILLDTGLDEKLIEEGRMRDAIRTIQDWRKEKGLKPGEKAEYKTNDEFFFKHKEEIEKVTNVELSHLHN